MSDPTNYSYKANASLVLESERSGKRFKEPTGEVESLKNKLVGSMGDRVSRSVPEELIKRRNKKGKQTSSAKSSSLDDSFFSSRKASNVLSDTHELSMGGYKPKTRESREAYESLLAFVSARFGDQPHSILTEAANEVLAILKDTETNNNAPKMKANVESLLDPLTDHQFNQIVNIGLRISDFVSEEDNAQDNNAEGIDEEHGVAVIIDDQDEEDDSDIDQVNEIASEEDDDDDDHDNDDNNMDDGDDAKEIAGAQGSRGRAGPSSSANHQLDVHEIDAYWLQREISKHVSNDDPTYAPKLANEVLGILGSSEERVCETKLVGLLGQERFQLIKKLLQNRKRIYYCTRIKQAQGGDEERAKIEEEMAHDKDGGIAILAELKHTKGAESWEEDRVKNIEGRVRQEAETLTARSSSASNTNQVSEVQPVSGSGIGSVTRASQTLDLKMLAFTQGDHTMSNRDVSVRNLWRKTHKGYEEAIVQPLKHQPFGENEKLIAIDQLPEWSKPAFKGFKELNRIQSKIYPTALHDDGNMLVCAPTGAGKTNVAVCTIMREMGKFVVKAPGKPDTLDTKRMQDNMKIVYIAPMKALVQEVVANFSQRLTESCGIKVRELSGDQQLSKAEIADTQIIVTTPEKWDIITRKSGDRTYTQLVRLVIIDEIHLLHNERGAVLEAIVARTLRQVEETQLPVRIVGISATLPNYQDVSTFLRVDPEKGLFFFDNSFRPVPLQQQYIGITEKKAIKRLQMSNTICYDKVISSCSKSTDQVIVFVHSRKETFKTAKALKDLAFERDELNLFLKDDSAVKEILQKEAEDVSSAELKEILPFGFAIHHAGMVRSDRNLVEALFDNKYIKVLVSTATLAWGVNLPAHTVIIKGTQVYSAEKGRWTELSQLDIMQMLGRAGRPQYDTTGEGIIITTQSELKYYLSLMNEALPIESQLIKRLPDTLNAEIVNGSIQNITEGAKWLRYTYLYVRMLRNPSVYGISVDEIANDPLLEQRTVDLVHSAALELDKAQLIKYDRKTGSFQSTALGRVAAHYYVSHDSIATYNDYMKPTMSDIELFRVFSLSAEFSNIIVRDEEKLELKKLLERVPIPVKESVEEPTAKTNVLLQAYISRLSLDGYAMACDLVYVHQSAGRIMRALHEICLSRGWASLANMCLQLGNMVNHRVWLSQSPLRQFPGELDEKTLRKMERSSIPWERYYDLTPQDLGEQVGQPKLGKRIHRLIRCFPKLELVAHVQPITRSTLRVELTMTPDFEYVEKYHGPGQLFWILVEDVDEERILHHEAFVLKKRFAEKEQLLTFTVPMKEPVPPQYFIKVVSDRFLHATYTLPVPFRHLILPEKYPPHTELLDLQPIPASTIRAPFRSLYAKQFSHFNAIQTQVFSALYEGNENVLVAAPTGSGKTICAEFAMLRVLESDKEQVRIVYVAPLQEICDEKFVYFSKRFGEASPFKQSVVQLVGETNLDLKLLNEGSIVVTTPEHWDNLSRAWENQKTRKNVRLVDLFVVDEAHLIGAVAGPTLEVVVSRMKIIGNKVNKIRIVGLSNSVANAKDLGGWLGCTSKHVFNFHPSVRPVPLEIFVQGFDAAHFGQLMLSMCKPVYNAICQFASTDPSKGDAMDVDGGDKPLLKPTIIYVTSRRQAELTAIDLTSFAAADEREGMFAGNVDFTDPKNEKFLAGIKDTHLQTYLKLGIGFYHEGMRPSERKVVEALFESGAIRVLVVNSTMCWRLVVQCALVVIMGTSRFDGKEHRYVDYPMAELAQMMGRASRPGVDAVDKCVLLCHNKMKEYYKKFLFSPLPVESHLDHSLEDNFCAEVVSKSIKNTQDAMDYLTWTFYYWRLTQNPVYYNLLGVTSTHVNDHLSELVETTLANLENSRCIEIEDDGEEISPLNLGMIASHYYIHYTTIELFASSLKSNTKLRGVLNVLANATEFQDCAAVRHHEERELQLMAKRLPYALFNAEYDSPSTKAYVLFQAHFSRMALNTDMRADKREVLVRAMTLLRGIVDVIASHGWLSPAVAAMELSQMIVQGLWNTDSPLLQIPHFTPDTVSRCKAKGVETIIDVTEMEPETIDKVLQLSQNKLQDVVEFCDNYPNLDVSYDIPEPDDITAEQPFVVFVTLEGDDDDDEEEDDEQVEYGKVVAPMYPKKKVQGWWVVVSDAKSETMLGIRWVTLQKSKTRVKLVVEAPAEVGKHNLKLLLISDSYLGCDRESEMEITVAEEEEGEEESEDEE